MKEIIINSANAAKIAALISDAERGARVRLIDQNQIETALEEVRAKIGVTKKALDGVAVSMDIHAQNFPSAYRGVPESTHFSAVYRRGTWRLVRVYRARVLSPGQAARVTLTDAAREAVLSRLSAFAI